MTHHNLAYLANLKNELDATPMKDRQPKTTTEKRKRTNATISTTASKPARVDLSGLNDNDLRQLQAAINMRLAPSEPTKTIGGAPVRKRQPGAGRKKGEKTVVVRVPECLVPAINKLIEEHKLNSVTDLK